jgi:DNA modification methylase
MGIIKEERIGIGGQRLILGDCLDVMPLLGKVDAVVTDVPYGISQKSNGLRRLGTGIELDPEYFDIACKRVDESTRQPDLFVEPPTPPEQQGMDV